MFVVDAEAELAAEEFKSVLEIVADVVIASVEESAETSELDFVSFEAVVAAAVLAVECP